MSQSSVEPEVFQAYEVFNLRRGVEYNGRIVMAVFWTKEEAQNYIHQEKYPEGCKIYNIKISVIHVTRIQGRWRRILVGPCVIEGQPPAKAKRYQKAISSTGETNERSASNEPGPTDQAATECGSTESTVSGG